MQKAPDFTLTHVAGREVSLSDYRGRPVVLLFSGRESQQQGESIEHTLRTRYSRDDVPLVAVPDLHTVPKLLRAVAKNAVQNSYKKESQAVTQSLEAEGKPLPADMSQVVVILPDWEGKVIASYGLTGVEKQAVAIVVDAEGGVKGQATGPDAGEKVLALLG